MVVVIAIVAMIVTLLFRVAMAMLMVMMVEVIITLVEEVKVLLATRNLTLIMRKQAINSRTEIFVSQKQDGRYF